MLADKIVSARKKKGLTQEELANLAGVTVRTVQRIESGESVPRSFTLKAIAAVLDIPLAALREEAPSPDTGTAHFLQVLCLSCFSYLVIPYIHFLIPSWLLKRQGSADPGIAHFGRRLILEQLYWLIAVHLLLLLTLAYNLLQAAYLGNRYSIHYLWPLLAMYIANAIIIAGNILKIRKGVIP